MAILPDCYRPLGSRPRAAGWSAATSCGRGPLSRASRPFIVTPLKARSGSGTEIQLETLAASPHRVSARKRLAAGAGARNGPRRGRRLHADVHETSADVVAVSVISPPIDQAALIVAGR